MKNSALIATAVLLFLPLSFAAAENVYAELIYYDFGANVQIIIPKEDESFTYSDANGNLKIGEMLPIGARILTNGGSAEITLVPNGSVMKLSPGTDFVIENMSAKRNSGNNDFSVATGQVRTVAARLSKNAKMRIRSESSLAEVRGTDFSFDADDGQLFVLEGLVDFSRVTGEGFDSLGETVQLGAGQFADALSDVFKPATFTPEQFARQFGELSQFSKAGDNMEIPNKPEPTGSDTAGASQSAAKVAERAAAKEAQLTAAQEAELAADKESQIAAAKAAQIAAAKWIERAAAQKTNNTGKASAENDFIFQALGLFGMEIGSITIDGETYGKAIFQPELALGKFRTKFYLPIIYTSNFLNPEDWYKPAGNDEWSFGTDKKYHGNAIAIVQDILIDLILKFKYIELGDNRDPFFFQLGNVTSMTLGHGILIRGYANDADFPAIRRIGLNLGVNLGGFKFQGLINDFAIPYLFGTRFQLGSKAALGISFATDTKPARDLKDRQTALSTAQQVAVDADPLFLNGAIDFEIPVVETDLLSMVLFSDFGVFLPSLRKGVAGLESGPQTKAVWDGKQLSNWGFEAGLFGNLAILDYRVQFQYYRGTFRSGFYNQTYDRIRGERATDVLDYLLNPDADKYSGYTIGVYGEGGLNFFNGNLNLNFGYLWPWTLGKDGSVSTDADDYFKFGFNLNEKLLSFLPWDMSLYLQYDRTRFRDLFVKDGGASLFDQNATLKGEVLIGFAPGIKLSVSVRTSAVRDSQGNVQYDSNGNTKMIPIVGITTVIEY